MPRNPKCKACPYHSTAKTVCVYGEGPEEADIMLVGLGPGDDEDEEGRPFVGKAGQLLDELLHEVQLDRRAIYITNATKCRPPNHKPDPVYVSTCADLYLHEEIVTVKPKVIVCLGDVAAKAIAGEMYSGTIGHYATKGRVVWSMLTPEHQAVVVITYHPSAVLRGQDVRGAIVVDLSFAKQYAQELRTEADAAANQPG